MLFCFFVFFKERLYPVLVLMFYLSGHNKNDLILTRHQMTNNTWHYLTPRHYLLEKIKQSGLWSKTQGRQIQSLTDLLNNNENAGEMTAGVTERGEIGESRWRGLLGLSSLLFTCTWSRRRLAIQRSRCSELWTCLKGTRRVSHSSATQIC